METQQDLLMSSKVIEGIQRPLGSVTELMRSHCKVVFDNANEGGSYIHNRRRDEYCKIYDRPGIFIVPVWVKMRHSIDEPNECFDNSNEEADDRTGEGLNEGDRPPHHSRFPGLPNTNA